MSDMYDDDAGDTRQDEPRRPSRARALWITLAVVVALFLAFTGFTAFWTERLWFDSTGYGTVFSTMVRTRIGLFLVFGLVMALAVAINLGAAFRYRPIFRPASPEQVSSIATARRSTPSASCCWSGSRWRSARSLAPPHRASGVNTCCGAMVVTSARRTPTSTRTSGSTCSTCPGCTSSWTSRWPC